MQRSSEVVIDHTAALEHCKSVRCTWDLSFGGHVITKPTKADRRESFETIDCTIPNCRTCTDVFDDSVIDLGLRDAFIRSSTALRALERHELDDDLKLLLPYRLCGYSLQTHKWHPLHVARLAFIQSTLDPFDELFLPHGHKVLLSTVVKDHVGGRNFQQGNGKDVEMDVVRARVVGTLILLHGPPGTGKTFTAEALAARLNRPLFPLKIADLASSSGEMEQRLAQLFQLSERWNCIVLMREADALVQRRSREDREGNRMTSGMFCQL